MICLVETASSRGTPSPTVFDTLPSPTPSSFKNSLFLCLNIQLLYLIISCLFYFQVNREYRQVDPSLDHKSSSCVYIYVSLPWLVRLWTLIRTDYYYYVNGPIKAEKAVPRVLLFLVQSWLHNTCTSMQRCYMYVTWLNNFKGLV